MQPENGILGKAGKRQKLEQPARVAALNPSATLRKIGFQRGQTLCDIGAGSGLFSIAAAQMGAQHVWAADTDADILDDLKIRAGALTNLQTVPVSGCSYPLPPASADWILLVTTLHEIAEKAALFSELRRLLTPAGSVCLIEFPKAHTAMGPPVEHRLGAQKAEALFTQAGFEKVLDFPLGDTFYCQTYVLSSVR